MNDQKDKRPEPGTDEYWEWARKRAEQRWKEVIADGPAEFEEAGVVCGDIETLTASDAELFPDDLEEYRPEERKPRLVPKKKD